MARVSAPTAIAAAQAEPKPGAAPAVQAAITKAETKAEVKGATSKPTGRTKRSAGAKAPARARRSASKTEDTPAEPAEAPAKAGARPADPPVPDGDPGAERITLPMWTELHRALGLARLDDRVDTTVRIRAMIELWNHDPRIRARVDRLAKRRASTLHRGRPRKQAS